MTFIFRNRTIFWDISKWNRGQKKKGTEGVCHVLANFRACLVVVFKNCCLKRCENCYLKSVVEQRVFSVNKTKKICLVP